MRYFAILKDSLVQTLDCKSLYVMSVFSLLIIILCGSIGATDLDERGALEDTMAAFRVVVRLHGLSSWAKEFSGMSIAVSDVQEETDGYTFTMRVSPLKEWRESVRLWDAIKRGKVKEQTDAVPSADVDPEPELEEKYIRDRLRERMMGVRSVQGQTDGDARVLRIRLGLVTKDVVKKVDRVSFYGFNKFVTHVPTFVLGIQILLATVFAGWGGVMLAILFTAGFIPNMLQKGTVDVLLARPVSRPILLVYRYIGGLTYAIITGAVLIGGCWLVMGLRTGVWNWGFLATLATLTGFFAILYAVGVFFAVLTKSTIAAIVAPIVVWLASFGVNQVHSHLVDHPESMWPGAVKGIVDALYYVLVKTTDVNELNSWLIAKGALGEAASALAESSPEIAWGRILITAAAYLVVFLGGACVIFSRKDY
jgi:ABC-type transport system involved in multi-copper enzyme maturation permease subunit